MKKALICPNEPVLSGFRVAQVEQEENVFPVAQPLYWIKCDDEIVADEYWYSLDDEKFKLVRATITATENNQPISFGSQSL